MNEIVDYLKGVKVKLNIKSDRQFAKTLGITQAYICDIMNGLRTPSEDICLKAAKLAGDDPERILLKVHTIKASESTRPYWDSLLKKVVNMSLIILFALAFSSEILHISSPMRYIM